MPTIVHTTDLGAEDLTTFRHSVALAQASGATLVSLHAGSPASATDRMPQSEPLLRAWGITEPAFVHRVKVHECCEDPVETVLDAIREVAPELVVATAHAHGALARFFAGSRAEAIAHNAAAPSLLFTPQARAFVSAQTGAIEIHRVIVPVGDTRAAEVAIEHADRFLQLAGVQRAELVLLHVGDPARAPDVAVVARPGRSVERHNVAGADLEAAIASAAETASLVVMATRGHDTMGDVLLGSHTDRVLHRAPCPVLSVNIP